LSFTVYGENTTEHVLLFHVDPVGLHAKSGPVGETRIDQCSNLSECRYI